MRHAVPVKDLLLLLGADAVVLVQKVEKWALGLFERSVSARLEVSQVREDALLKLLRVLDGAAKGLEAERQAAHNVGARDVKEVVPGQRVSKTSRPVCQSGVTYHNTQDTYSPVGSKKRRMYWSGDQSTGAEIKKYLTGCASVRSKAEEERESAITVVNLLQRDNRVCGQALLSILVQQERLWCNRASLRRAAHDGLLCRIHCSPDPNAIIIRVESIKKYAATICDSFPRDVVGLQRRACGIEMCGWSERGWV